MTAIAVARSSLDTSLRRMSRSWGLWLLLLVAPVGARYMIPQADGTGIVIAIGRQTPEMTSAFLGVSLGIVVTTLLLPVAWVYLRSNTLRRQPWQVEEVTAASRIAIALGRFGADAAVLLAVLVALSLAGIILGVVIDPVGGLDIGAILFGLWLVAAPSLIGIAGLRILFDAVPWLRGGLGDFGYFLTWIAAIAVPAANEGKAASFGTALADFGGFMRPLQYGAPAGAHDFAIGGVDNLLPGHVPLDVVAGLMSPGYVAARLAWIGIAVGMAVLAGLVYRPHRPRRRLPARGRLARWLAAGPPPAVVRDAPPAPGLALPALGLALAEARLIGAGRLFRLLAVGVGMAGLVGDFRHIGSPAALLLLAFALSAHAGRSEARGLLALTATASLSPWLRRGALLLAGTGWMLLLALPAVLRQGPAVLGLAGAVGAAASLVAIGLAMVSRSAFAPRLVLLIAWYVYLSA